MNLNDLPLEIENMILDYKSQIEHREKFKKVLKEIKYKVQNEMISISYSNILAMLNPGRPVKYTINKNLYLSSTYRYHKNILYVFSNKYQRSIKDIMIINI